MGYQIVDEYNLTLPNNYLELFIPAYNKSLVFLVKYRKNPVASLLNYGPLPTTTSTGLTVYNGVGGGTGGSATPAAAGELPAASWVKGMQFNVPSTFYVTGTFPWGNNDIWFTQVPLRLFEVNTLLTPAFTRISVDIPTNQNQETLQDQVAGGVDQDFGWKRGRFFTVHIPNIHYGYDFGNDSNIALYTRCEFRYAEQVVQPVADPATVFAVITGQIPAHHVQLPVVSPNTQVEGALNQTYGFTGFDVYPPNQRGAALVAYATAISKNSMLLAQQRGGS